MEDKLKLLFLLQKIDSELEDLEELKGDLPLSVKEIEDKSLVLLNQINDKTKVISDTKSLRDKADSDIIEYKAKLEKYKAQLYSVKNNREYDAITKETDYANNKISEAEKIFLESEDLISKFQTEFDEINNLSLALNEELKLKKAELEIIIKENEDELLNLQNEKSKILVRLDEDSINQYERIHSGRSGKAIVVLRKDSCGGCNNRIPPQHLIELQRNDKIYNCGHCGRIVISTFIAENASQVMQS